MVKPVGYLEMVWLLSRCALVLTDSGGLQKEAYFHRKPCLTLRDETEWVELVDLGWNRLAPPGQADIAKTIRSAIGQRGATGNPYGDGDAAERIVDTLIRS